MNFRRVGAVVLRQLYLYRSSPQRVLPLFIWVVLDIVLWGFIARFLGQVSHSTFQFGPALLGAVLLWDFLTRVMQGVTTAFFEDVWSRNFMGVFASPMRISEYLAGLISIGVSNSLVALVAMYALAWAIFGLSVFSYGVAILPFLLVLFLTGIALGVFGAGLVLRLGPASEWLIWPIPTLVSPFVGVFYPISVLPPWMQLIGRAVAPSYVFAGLRAVVSGHPAPWGDLGIGAALAAAYMVLACWVFVRIYRYAIRAGLIARYSAETVT